MKGILKKKYHILLVISSLCALILFFSYRTARSGNTGEIERIASSYTAQVTKKRAERDYSFVTGQYPPAIPVVEIQPMRKHRYINVKHLINRKEL